jgi:hypothetical protein
MCLNFIRNLNPHIINGLQITTSSQTRHWGAWISCCHERMVVSDVGSLWWYATIKGDRTVYGIASTSSLSDEGSIDLFDVSLGTSPGISTPYTTGSMPLDGLTLNNLQPVMWHDVQRPHLSTNSITRSPVMPPLYTQSRTSTNPSKMSPWLTSPVMPPLYTQSRTNTIPSGMSPWLTFPRSSKVSLSHPSPASSHTWSSPNSILMYDPATYRDRIIKQIIFAFYTQYPVPEHLTMSSVWLYRTIYVYIMNRWSKLMRTAQAVVNQEATSLPQRLDGGQPGKFHDTEWRVLALVRGVLKRNAQHVVSCAT